MTVSKKMVADETYPPVVKLEMYELTGVVEQMVRLKVVENGLNTPQKRLADRILTDALTDLSERVKVQPTEVQA